MAPELGASEEMRLDSEARWREAELQLRREELAAQREKDRLPIRIPLWVAALSVLGAVIVAALQGWANIRLEKEKFQSSLILKAIETGNIKDSATNLRFMVEAGLLQDSSGKLSALLNTPTSIPVLPSSIGPQVHPVEPGQVDVMGTDKVEFSCTDLAHPEVMIRMGIDQEKLLEGRAGDSLRTQLPDQSSGVHELWWSLDAMSSTLMCEVAVNKVVRYRSQVSGTSNNGSILIQVR